jgi:RNA polymerase sigma factor (sigma-70 family)
VTDGGRLVHIIDDDASFRSALERRLKNAGYKVAAHGSAQYFLDNLPNESMPSCVLLDVRMPGLSGPELQERLIKLGSTLPIIFVSGNTDIPATVRVLKAGADDFLTKPVTSEELLNALERAFAHHQSFREQQIKLDAIRERLSKLTPRERQVFDLIIRGRTNKQAGRELGATERTIKAHRHRVMEKLQVQTLPELVSLAERTGLGSGGGQPD